MIAIQHSIYSQDPRLAPVITHVELGDVPAMLAKYSLDMRTPILVSVKRDRKADVSVISLSVALGKGCLKLIQILEKFVEPQPWAILDVTETIACEIADAFIADQEQLYPGLIIGRRHRHLRVRVAS